MSPPCCCRRCRCLVEDEVDEHDYKRETEREREGWRGVDKDRLPLLLMVTISAETDEVNNDAEDDEPYYVTLSATELRAWSVS